MTRYWFRQTDNCSSLLNATPQDMASAFFMAHELVCTGLTVYRPGSRAHQGLACAQV